LPAVTSSPERVLVASLRAGVHAPGLALESLVGSCDQERLVDLAISEGLAGPAGALLGPFLAPDHGARLLRRARVELVRHHAYLGLLEKVAGSLEQAGVTWVVLKGPVLAELAYHGSPHGYADVDLLVAPRQMKRAIDALEAIGATPAERDWRSLAEEAKGQLSMAVSGSPIIDLHWHLVYLRSARERWRISSDELLERRRRVRLGGVQAWSLDPEDLTAHVALHASFGAAEQLRRLLDVDRAIACWTPDWELLVRRCHSWRVGLPVGVVLNRARRTLGAAVPDEVVRELAQGELNYLLVRQLSDWKPRGGLPGGRSLRNGVTRSLRDRWSTTAMQVAGEAWRAVVELPLGGRAGWSRPGEATHDQPVSSGIGRYLDMVDRVDRYGHLQVKQGTPSRTPSPS
jgi:hypothetical protein